MFRTYLIAITVALQATLCRAESILPHSPADQVAALQSWLADRPLTEDSLPELKSAEFATAPLSQQQAEAALKLLWESRAARLRDQRRVEMDKRQIKIGELIMPFWYRTFGEKPDDGRSLFISMHGGGGAPAAVNDQQYENQKRLYKPKEGIYLVPRAPTNTWNLWHQEHIDVFFDRLITNMVIFEDVDPDKVYLMGYSAGGDGVYQLAPRMADRFAAAAMMAGHPNETQPDGLRNLPFTIHVGERDAGYNRNKIAREWKQKLAELRKQEPQGYRHHVEIHPARGHWMNLEDAVAVPWMAEFRRNRYPTRVVWKQDDVTHHRFYWLQMDPDYAKGRPRVAASVTDNTIRIEQADVSSLTLLLHDKLVSLDGPVHLIAPDGRKVTVHPTRTIAVIAQTLVDRNDPAMAAWAEVPFNLTPVLSEQE